MSQKNSKQPCNSFEEQAQQKNQSKQANAKGGSTNGKTKTEFSNNA